MNEKESKLKELRRIYTEKFIELKDIEAEIKELEKEIVELELKEKFHK